MTVTPERLAQLIDQSFGDGPPPEPVEQHLRSGRRAVRAARLRVGCGLAVAVLALAAPVAVSTGLFDDGAATDPPPATAGPTQPTQKPPFTWRSQDPIPQFHLREDQAFIDVDGVLVVRPSAAVVERTDDVWDVPGVLDSVSLVTIDEGQEHWTFAYLLDADENGGSSSVTPAEVHGASRAQWLADEIARTSANNTELSYLSIDKSGELTALGGATVLDEVQGLPTGLAPAGSPSAGAIVAVGEARLCAYARWVGRSPEYVYLNAAQFGPDLDSCLQAFDNWE